MIVPDYAFPAALIVPHFLSDLLPLLENLAIAAARHTGVILLAQSPETAAAFAREQPRPERFTVVAAQYDSPWIRDRAPVAVRHRDGMRWVLPRMPNIGRDRDDRLFEGIVAREHSTSKVLIAGGNLVAGPRGIAVSSAAVLVENELTAEDLLRHASEFGIRRWLLFPPLTLEPSGHADVHVRFLRPGLAAVAWNPEDSGDQHVALSIEAQLRSVLPAVRILRLPVRAEGASYASPLNWVQLGRNLLVPVFRFTPDEDRGVFVERLGTEGFHVTLVDSSATLGLGGSLHCLTASVFV